MTQQQITFGKWVRQARIEQGLTLQVLAGRRMGLEPATISRSENEQSQVTMLTAVRLCKALGLGADDVIRTFIDPDMENNDGTSKVLNLVNLSQSTVNAHQENTATFQGVKNNQSPLRASDVRDFIIFYQRDNELGNKFLLQLLNKIVEVNNAYANEMKEYWSNAHTQDVYPSKPYSLAEVERLIRKNHISRGEIYYPELSADTINLIYDQDGVLIPEDARRLTEIALASTGTNPAMPHEQRHRIDTILQRLKHTSVERTKLDDVIGLDILTKRQGKLLRIYWQAALIIDEIQCRQNDRNHPQSWPSDWQENEFSLANVYILIGRWLQLVGLDIGQMQQAYMPR